MLALRAGIPELRDCWTAIGKQSFLVGRIEPCPRHNPRTIAWPDLIFVSIDDSIEGGGIDQSFFHEQRFERLGAEGRIGGNDLVFVVMILSVHISRTSRSNSPSRRPFQEASPVQRL